METQPVPEPRSTRREESNMRERILEATLAAISWSGIEHFSIIEVSRIAKVSRQSLYRYFRNKDDLLNGLIQHLRNVVEDRMARQVELGTTLEERIFAISGYDVDATGGRNSTALLSAEPALMLEHLNSQPSRLHGIMEKALAPFLDEAERASGVEIDRDRLVETIERLRMSLFLVPAQTPPDFAVATITSIVKSAIAHPQAWAKTRE